MKLFGNSKKKTSSAKSASVKEKSSKPAGKKAAESGSKGGLIGMLAKRRIEKAKAAIDNEDYRLRTPEERKRIEEEIERYQRRKVTGRLVAVIIIVLLAVAAIVFYKNTVVPPSVAPTPTPMPGACRITHLPSQDARLAPSTLFLAFLTGTT